MIIKLTTVTGKPIYVNFDYITDFIEGTYIDENKQVKQCSCLCFSASASPTGASFDMNVIELPDTIMCKLAEKEERSSTVASLENIVGMLQRIAETHENLLLKP